MTAEKEWAGTTYGNGWMHKWLIRMLRLCNVKVFYAFVAVFVVPVCLVVNPGRRTIYRYFRERWGLSPIKALWKTYRNFCLFGQVVVDKFAMYAGKRFDVEIEGYEEFRSRAARPEGFMQLSAHIGNYEIAGYTLTSKKRLNALVFAGEKASVMNNRNRLFDRNNINMIGIRSDMGHMFEINNALGNGEIVSMSADRMFGSAKSVTRTFLGGEAELPMGPFAVATSRGVDVIAVNVMKVAATKYRIYVTALDYDKAATRKEQTQQLSRAYVAELERMLRMYPEQWYNYYEYWK